jgi:hypothetical protein
MQVSGEHVRADVTDGEVDFKYRRGTASGRVSFDEPGSDHLVTSDEICVDFDGRFNET